MNKLELYESIFCDGSNYTDFYFNKRRNKVTTYTKTIGDDTIALVGVVDITLSSNKQAYKSALITGVCTATLMQGKGVMQELLANTINDLKSKGYVMLILSPMQDNYYKKYGFESLVKGNIITLNYNGSHNYSTKNACKNDATLLLDLYNNIMSKYNNFQIVNQEIIDDFLDETTIDNNNIQILYKANIPIGWIIVENNEITHAVVERIEILNNFKHLDKCKCFNFDINGRKDLFQIKYLDNNLKRFKLNNTFILNKY